MLAACALVLALDRPAAAVWREPLFDAYQKLLPRPRASAPAIIVEIDEPSLEAHGQWPWPRTAVAELMSAIARAGPAAVGVDLLFVEPDRSAPGADAALAQALQGRKFVLGIAGLDHPDRRFRVPPRAAPVRQSSARELPLRRFVAHLQSRPEIDRAAAGRGLISVDTADRVIRRVPLVARVGEVTVPALSVEMLRVAAGVPILGIDERGGERVALVLGDVAIPVQSDGTFRPYFGPHDQARFVSAGDVLSGAAGAELLRDKLVLVGVTGLGLLDFQATPLGERIPGVEIHAQILEQVFDRTYLHRPTGAALIEAGLLLAAGLALVALVPRVRAHWSVSLLALVLALFAAVGLAAFKAGRVIDVAGPALGALAVFGALLAATLAEADRQRRLLREAQARVAGELEAARRIQMGLLPAPRVRFAGEARFSLDARLEPARVVGGDFYDCFMLDAHRLFFTVADVSGKGLPASLFMALSKSLLKSIALRSGADPGAILAQASAEIARDNAESFFVTVFAGILDARSGTLEFCNAGHEPPYLCRPGRAPERLEHPGGPPLCVIEGFAYASARRRLAPGESLCVITDGVTDAMDPSGSFYGRERLTDLLRKAGDPASTLNVVRDDVRRFTGSTEQADDLTLLCVRFNS
ncbi:MAG TPA: CHASE2 domain-containing protein [Burkholderiales bacterium]|nr:CHASE2 domain-containing protein [Burkholderiales bacterium]